MHLFQANIHGSFNITNHNSQTIQSVLCLSLLNPIFFFAPLKSQHHYLHFTCFPLILTNILSAHFHQVIVHSILCNLHLAG
ncbi:unnamed protein product [Amaranthus hypochondriacus]